MKMLCLLSNLLGNKVLSAHYREAIEQIPDLDVVYEYLSTDDFRTNPVPSLVRKSNLLEVIYVAERRFKDIDFTSYDVIMVGCFEFLWVVRKIMDSVPVIAFIDTTPIAARRMLTQRVGTLQSRIKREMLSVCFQLIFSRVFRKAALFLPTSPWCGRSLVDDFGVKKEKVKSNYPALDLSFWNPGDRVKNAGDPLKLLFVGNDFKRKGGTRLLDIFNRLDIDASLMIISNDPCLKDLNLPERVQILSNVAHDDIPRYFVAADLFLFPTMHDQLPLVTTEAMACGTPVLVNDVGALADIVSTGVNGILFKPDATVEAWVQAITDLDNDRDLLKNMSINARQTARDNFSKTVFVRNVEQAIEDAANYGD